MAAIKSNTDLSQSKVLSQILPHETADMCYKCIEEDPYDVVLRPYSEWREEYKGLLVNKEVDVIPCWSLAALLGVLEHPRCFQGDKPIYWFCGCFGKDNLYHEVEADNPVDACYKMILELNKLKIL